MARWSVTAIALIVLVILSYLIALRLFERFGRSDRKDIATNPSAAGPMVTLEHGALEIHDYNAWFAMLPRAIRSALRRGITDPEAVLVEVFSSLLPQEQWPPLAGSSYRWQWHEMVQRTAEILEHEPSPTPTRQRPGLRVVPGSSA